MRLKDYGRNFKLRKVYFQTPGLLMVGVDIGNSCHTAVLALRQLEPDQAICLNYIKNVPQIGVIIA